MVRVTVCKSCAWSNDKIRLVLEGLRAENPKGIDLVKVDCLDACKKDPAVKVEKKLLAPARPKKLRKRIEKKLRAGG